MFIRLDINQDTSICVDHANIIIEKENYQVDNKQVYAVGVFAITTVANFDDGVVSSAVSFQKKSSYRQLIYTREFRNPQACEEFYADIIKQMNESVKQTVQVTADNGAVTDRLDKLLQNSCTQCDDTESLEDHVKQQTQLLEKLVELLTPKERATPKSRAKKKDAENAT